MLTKEYRYVSTLFAETDVYHFPMQVSDVLNITYVAARGKTQEEGAVQRILNKKRISDIRDFVLEGNIFVNSFILNWTDLENKPKIKKETIDMSLQGRRAQILDGQHRLAGLQEAVNKKPEIGEQNILISLCIGLDTQKAAKIFLNINSEQKPVPKSLIYDLFGEAFENKEHAINRATDIIDYLNTGADSPYFGKIKYPGAPQETGLVDLAIFVNAIKPHLSEDGVFNKYKLTEIERQKAIIVNFYSAIKDIYEAGHLWDKKSENPFLKAAGVNGSFEFLTETLIPQCHSDKNFSKEHMKSLMKLDKDYLLFASDFKKLDGKTARKSVKEFFTKGFTQDITISDDYEF